MHLSVKLVSGCMSSFQLAGFYVLLLEPTNLTKRLTSDIACVN